MQSRVAIGPALSKLALEDQASDRFVYTSRFVPFILRDKAGAPVITIAQQYWNGLVRSREGSDHTAGASEGELPTRRSRPVMYVKPVGPSHSELGTTPSKGSGAPAVLIGRPDDDIEQAAAASDLGIVLLERTRLTPVGFELGEHVLSMSLAPGEEVVLEQRVYSERSLTYEDLNDVEESADLELGSSLTTELSLGLTRALTETRNKGFDIGTNLSVSYYGNYTVSGGYKDSVNDVLTDTRQETLRHVATTTEKLTSRRRAQHKITMKISEITKFESSNKRVVKNPNLYTPIDLVYFKILQKMQISHERFGIRLCWAPFIRDPGVVLEQALRAGRDAIEGQIPPASIPPEEQPPTPPEGGVPPYMKSTGLQELTNWGFWGDMRADYTFEIGANGASVWDPGTPISVTWTTTGWGKRGTPSVSVVNAEATATGVRILLHGGADWGGAGAHLYVNLSARFVPSAALADAEYATKLGEWQARHDAWAADVATRKAARGALVDEAYAKWKADYLKNFDPVAAAFQMMMSLLFPVASLRDEGFEIEKWNKVFDFEQSAFQYYPSWWGDSPRRDPSQPADAFVNASWMRVFLPVRIGMERDALALILERRVHTGATTTSHQQAIDALVGELEARRTQYFGGPMEVAVGSQTPCPDVERPYQCLGHWTEFLPTDGTHLEVVQAVTTAMDDVSEQSVADAHAASAALVASQEASEKLRETIADKIDTSTTDPSVDVVVADPSAPR